MNGVLTEDERRVLGAAHQLGLVLSSDWPDVAGHLLAQGADGEATSELAGLPRTASPWSVDQLTPKLLSELAIPELPADQAGDLVARLVGRAAQAQPGAGEFTAIRKLARLSPDLDYPGANSRERDAATDLENTLRTSEPLDIDLVLLRAMSATWF